MKVLHAKLLADVDVDVDVSYSQFTRLIPSNVVKPKPEDWGTCLCMTCLNPEHKLDALKKLMPEVNLSIFNFMEKSEEELEIIFDKIKKAKENVKFLEWTKDNGSTLSTTKAISYHCRKVACNMKPNEFAEKLKTELVLLENIQKG